jgi:hypothetical protein
VISGNRGTTAPEFVIILYILLILYKLSLNLSFGIPFNLMFAVRYVFHVALISSYVYALYKEAGEISK